MTRRRRAISRMIASKGQFEMVGLVFVVLIIVVGIMLYMVSIARDPTARVGRSIVLEENARSYLLVLSQTDTDCGRGVDIAALARACKQNERIGGCASSCTALKSTTQAILSQTLDEDGQACGLYLDSEPLASCDTACSPAWYNVTAAPSIPIPVNGGTAKLTLALCR